ncbi:hypothetical protein O181_081657 [Austropuccinia psidii MF-1]|uniref:Uncharacterized protein n=1 Tax=Austropuccinia psidii MF-1 TaxID=1389203 RepID=A0A9Q3FP08_9BASI|nr:hypothetical protein [Austropuccinia psidii MF-1]
MVGSFSTHAYHLNLPSQWKSIHPVLHISLLEPVKTSTIPNWHQEPPAPIIIEEEEEWEVPPIRDSKLKRGKLWYLVSQFFQRLIIYGAWWGEELPKVNPTPGMHL